MRDALVPTSLVPVPRRLRHWRLARALEISRRLRRCFILHGHEEHRAPGALLQVFIRTAIRLT